MTEATGNFEIPKGMIAMDSAPPKLYTQEDMDNAVASVRAESAGRLGDAERREQVVRNSLFNYKVSVGQELQEWLEDTGVTVCAELVAMFERLDIVDYLPKKRYSVAIKFEGTTYYDVDAPSPDAALKLVEEEAKLHEIKQEIDYFEWETTGEVEEA